MDRFLRNSIILAFCLAYSAAFSTNELGFFKTRRYSSKQENNVDYIFNIRSSDAKEDLPVLGAWKTLLKPEQQTISPSSSDDAEKRIYPVLSTPLMNTKCQQPMSISTLPPPPPALLDYLYGVIDVSPYHEMAIEALWKEVKKRRSIHFFTPTEVNCVHEAVKVAYVALYGRKTLRSFENCIDRSRGTATVLGELKVDPVLVIASFLHEVFDYVSEKDITICKALLKTRVGAEAVALVEKCYRLPKLRALKAEYTGEQSENHIQMLIVSAEDYRVLYVRLAERLHTMRVLKSLSIDPSEKFKIAQEALNVYAPLAHKMGIMKVKGELEDLAFRIIYPEMYLATRYTQIAAMKAFQDATESINEILSKDEMMKKYNATYKFSHRVKDKYQLFMKMKRKNFTDVSEVRDSLGLRIIFDYPRIPGESPDSYRFRGAQLCYNFVFHLRSLSGWIPAMNGLKDYISETKPNGYQSIHQYIRNVALKANVEVQVRTKEMHLRAELGNAAHWYYKDCIYREDVVNLKTYKIAWRSDEQRGVMSPAELINIARRQILASRVLVFLEDKSHVLNLRKGSTALDAAFAIHKEIGLSTSSVRVKDRRSALGRVLQNGDVISVERTERGQPVAKQHWMNYVKHPHSLYTLRKYLKEHDRENTITAGLVQLIAGIVFNKDRIIQIHGTIPDAQSISRMIGKKLRISNYADFLLQLGTSTTGEATSSLARLFDIHEKEFSMGNMARCFLWARIKSKLNWKEEAEVVENVVVPTIYRILPSLGMDIKSNWRQSGFSLFRMSSPKTPKIQEERRVTEALVEDGMKHKSSIFIAADLQSDEALIPVSLFHEQTKLTSIRSPYILEATSMGSLNLEAFRRMYIEQALVTERTKSMYFL